MGTQAVEVAQAVPLTSEVSSEVEKLIVEQAPQAELDVLIPFAAAYKSFHQSLTPVVRKAAEDLKKAFNVRQGKGGTHLLVNGEEMDWKKFVDKYFGITPRRFNQILGIDDETKAPKGSKTTKTLNVVAPDQDGNKFEELDSRLHAALEELERIKADPVEACVSVWRELEPDEVVAQLKKIVRALDLDGYVKVEFDDVQ